MLFRIFKKGYYSRFDSELKRGRSFIKALLIKVLNDRQTNKLKNGSFYSYDQMKKEKKKEAHHTIGILFHQYYLQSNFSFMRLYNLFAKRGEGLPLISI